MQCNWVSWLSFPSSSDHVKKLGLQLFSAPCAFACRRKQSDEQEVFLTQNYKTKLIKKNKLLNQISPCNETKRLT